MLGLRSCLIIRLLLICSAKMVVVLIGNSKIVLNSGAKIAWLLVLWNVDFWCQDDMIVMISGAKRLGVVLIYDAKIRRFCQFYQKEKERN